jgi:hypothetical protein
MELQGTGRHGVVRLPWTLPGGVGRRSVVHENVDDGFRSPTSRRNPASTAAGWARADVESAVAGINTVSRNSEAGEPKATSLARRAVCERASWS